jgi:hypothetical protein
VNRDAVFVVMAYAVNLLSVFLFPDGAQRDAYLLLEALGMTLACALPALLARLVLKRGGYHGWTLGLALVIAFGAYYNATH